MLDETQSPVIAPLRGNGGNTNVGTVDMYVRMYVSRPMAVCMLVCARVFRYRERERKGLYFLSST